MPSRCFHNVYVRIYIIHGRRHAKRAFGHFNKYIIKDLYSTINKLFILKKINEFDYHCDSHSI